MDPAVQQVQQCGTSWVLRHERRTHTAIAAGQQGGPRGCSHRGGHRRQLEEKQGLREEERVETQMLWACKARRFSAEGRAPEGVGRPCRELCSTSTAGHSMAYQWVLQVHLQADQNNRT